MTVLSKLKSTRREELPTALFSLTPYSSMILLSAQSIVVGNELSLSVTRVLLLLTPLPLVLSLSPMTMMCRSYTLPFSINRNLKSTPTVTSSSSKIHSPLVAGSCCSNIWEDSIFCGFLCCFGLLFSI